jgi:hypothetical protein
VKLPGKVQKVIRSPFPGEPEKAEIAIDGADGLYKEIRIENKLQDDEGNLVQVKPGEDVDVTVESERKKADD